MTEKELQLILTAIFRRAARIEGPVALTEKFSAKFSVKFDEILRHEGVSEGVNDAVNDTINEPNRKRKEDGSGAVRE
jgi:hypothetical protein